MCASSPALQDNCQNLHRRQLSWRRCSAPALPATLLTMPPYTAAAIRSTQAKAGRPTPAHGRVVPALPLALSRPTQVTQATAPAPAHETVSAPAAQQAEQYNGTRDEKKPVEKAEQVQPYPAVASHDVLRNSDTENDLKETPSKEPAAAQVPDVAAISPRGQNIYTVSPYFGTKANRSIANEESSSSPIDNEDPLAVTKPPPTVENNGPSATSRNQLKPTSRIPRELPPPFYPSSEGVSTPNSVGSSGPAPQNVPSNVTIHHPRPSTGHIQFGGFADSSNVSPAPPTTGSMAYPPPPPVGFGPPGFGPPPFFPPGHIHHHSNAGLMHPMGMPPSNPSNGFNYPREQPLHNGQQPQWIGPDGPVPYPSLQPHEPYSPHRLHNHANGVDPHSRSGSQTSARTPDKAAPNGHHATFPKQVDQGYSLNSLGGYLLGQFGQPDFADLVVEVARGDGEPSVPPFPVHALIVARSPALETQIKQASARSRTLTLHIPRAYFNDFAFAEALRFLYGGRLLSAQMLHHGLPHDDMTGKSEFSVARERMDQAIAYTFTGHALQVPPIITSGFEVIEKLLRPDTLEQALSFSLSADPLTQIHGEALLDSRIDSLAEEHTPERLTHGAAFLLLKKRLLLSIVDFIVFNFPAEFTLNTNAPQLAGCTRLPTASDTRSITHQHRLSRIRFGELPPEAPNAPSPFVTLLSSILLSLPSFVLKHVLEHYALCGRIGPGKVAETMQAVVEERERRRQKVAMTKPSRESLDRHLWQNVYQQEQLDHSDQHPSGLHFSVTALDKLD